MGAVGWVWVPWEQVGCRGSCGLGAERVRWVPGGGSGPGPVGCPGWGHVPMPGGAAVGVGTRQGPWAGCQGSTHTHGPTCTWVLAPPLREGPQHPGSHPTHLRRAVVVVGPVVAHWWSHGGCGHWGSP